jgi:hypothetical protein
LKGASFLSIRPDRGKRARVVEVFSSLTSNLLHQNSSDQKSQELVFMPSSFFITDELAS